MYYKIFAFVTRNILFTVPERFYDDRLLPVFYIALDVSHTCYWVVLYLGWFPWQLPPGGASGWSQWRWGTEAAKHHSLPKRNVGD